MNYIQKNLFRNYILNQVLYLIWKNKGNVTLFHNLN